MNGGFIRIAHKTIKHNGNYTEYTRIRNPYLDLSISNRIKKKLHQTR